MPLTEMELEQTILWVNKEMRVWRKMTAISENIMSHVGQAVEVETDRGWRKGTLLGMSPHNTAKVEVMLDGMSFIVHNGLVRSLATGRWIGDSDGRCE